VIAPAGASEQPFVTVHGLFKRFGSVQALAGVDLTIEPGEVHALLGANGAGKSTLIKVLAGVTAADAGLITVRGLPVDIRDPRIARSLGLSFIHQELSLVPRFTALQNMALGLVPGGRLGFLRWTDIQERVARIVSDLEIDFDLRRAISGLNVAEKWMIAIARCLMFDAQLIAMDEPTASLSVRETDVLFRVVRRLTESGIAVLYVSHRLEEVGKLCSRATVFREGRVVATLDRKDLVRSKMIGAIVGEQPEALQILPAAAMQSKKIILEARDLSRGSAVLGATFQLHEGEVLGFAGLVGAGRSELARMLVGADKADEGEIYVAGQNVTIRNPTSACAMGIGLVPEERRTQALIMNKSVCFNLNLAYVRDQKAFKWLPFTSSRQGATRAVGLVDSLHIHPRRIDIPVRNLSGGNQQKVALGRWLDGKARILILDEPTRGVDIGARAEIHRVIRELAGRGLGLIVISSDFEELLGCDRVLVMSRGRIAAELTGDAISEQRMLRAAYETEEGVPRGIN